MSYSTPPEIIKSARKQHCCDWCEERIEIGESYIRWRWYNGGDVGTAKLHHECDEAFICLQESNDGGYTEFYSGDNPRGCYCADDPCVCGSVERIAKAKETQPLTEEDILECFKK